MARKRREITDILAEMGVLKTSDAAAALDHSIKKHVPLPEHLINSKLATEEDVTKALAIQNDMEFIDLDKSMIQVTSMNLIPREMIQRHQVLPIEKRDGKLRIVIGDPTDIETLDALRFRLNMPLETCLAVKSKIKAHIDRLYEEERKSLDLKVKELTIDKNTQSIDIKAGETNAEDAPIIKLVQTILGEAVKSPRSDIHLEPMKDRVRLRYRIDGVCIERDNIQKRMQGPVTARLKIMSGMDIAEKRLPQDGRIKILVDNKPIDFRVSSLPAYHGESVVLRILRPDNVKIGITAMGFEEEDYQQFKRIIARPNGIFLVTGPTGSGKTTTLYGALAELNKPDKKIITAEDPVEYNFAGINQCQVKEAIGLSFSKILRSMLRQRGPSTSFSSVKSATSKSPKSRFRPPLTGHLVFSTLHTSTTSPSAITPI